ncbi:MAG TPA: GNAT family N-acetyltransferase [Gemmatimonadaceae bacterium]|nr:GNAT family N-acetyltransferase [Gemmatimonadaceae bacterium]
MPPNVIEQRAPESAHFGLRIAMARPTEPDGVAAALAVARADAVELLVFRISTNAAATVHAVEAVGGRLCDSLLYFERVYGEESLTSSAAVRQHAAGDTARIVEIAGRAFHDYAGHWHVDHRIPRERADALYAAWARDICGGRTPFAHRIFVIEERGAVSGFAAFREAGDRAFDLELGAVDPSAQGKGLYRELITAANAWLYQHANMRRALYSTQLNNYRTIRAIERLGYVLVDSVQTFHVWL